MMNLFSDDVRRNPYGLYDQIRSVSPLFHEPEGDIWAIFDYEGARRALSDHEVFSSHLATAANHPTPQWMVFMDPPRHSKLRALITKAFTPRVVAGLEPRIRSLARELLDKNMERGVMDLAGDFSIPLPMMVIAGMIGIPPEDWPRFRRWSDAILKLSHTVRGMKTEEAESSAQDYFAVTAEMKAYLPGLIEPRLKNPQDDLLTKLIEAEVDGVRLSEDEILGFFQLLVVGGQETTTNLINNAILCFMENPEQLARLRAGPEGLPLAIEEVLRYRSPFQFIYRGTLQDVEMHGKTIPKGKLVLVMLGSANRDPKHFKEPNRFDITRDPNPHLAFGHGIHFCIGAPLSRLEARVALPEIFNRMQQFELAENTPWEPRKSLHVHGPTRLPIRFQPATQVSGR
jgi:cytochrome P450